MNVKDSYVLDKKINKMEVFDVNEDEDDMDLDVNRVQIDDILDKNIIITDFELRPSDYEVGEYAIINLIYNDLESVLMSGSKALVRKLKKYEDKLPIRCRITKKLNTKNNREYYTMASPISDYEAGLELFK